MQSPADGRAHHRDGGDAETCAEEAQRIATFSAHRSAGMGAFLKEDGLISLFLKEAEKKEPGLLRAMKEVGAAVATLAPQEDDCRDTVTRMETETLRGLTFGVPDSEARYGGVANSLVQVYKTTECSTQVWVCGTVTISFCFERSIMALVFGMLVCQHSDSKLSQSSAIFCVVSLRVQRVRSVCSF